MLATGIAAGIAGNALYGLGKKSVSELRNVLQEDAFSTPLASLQNEFEASLKDSLQDELAEIDDFDSTEIDSNWEDIINEINSIEAVLISNKEAITKITEAIQKGLDKNIEEESETRGRIEIAVARTYRKSVLDFLANIEEQGLNDTFQNRTNLRVAKAVSSIDEDLQRVESRIIQHNDSEIKNEGFDRFDPLFFRRKEAAEPKTAWRRGFKHIEIASGYALERERPQKEGNDRVSINQEIIDLLKQNRDTVVLGEPGSGKSTICKQVATEWHNMNSGSVFYRRSSSAVPFTNPGTLIGAINAADSDVLVVVEDAVYENAAVLFEVVDEFRDDSGVSFLLDARNSQWDGSDDAIGRPDLANLRSQLNSIEVPDMDLEECRRTIEHFESLTDEGIERSAESIFEEIDSADYGAPLHLAYTLTSPASGSGSPKGEMSVLEHDVYKSFNKVDNQIGAEEIPTRLKHKMGILVNLLNASRLPISKGFLHSVASDDEESWQIESILDSFEGIILTKDEKQGTYRTFHERWSTLYLSRAYDELDVRAVTLFEDCVNSLSHLPEDSEKISSIQNWLSSDSNHLSNIQIAPEKFAEYFVTNIAQISTRQPELAPLFIDSEISFSDVSSEVAKINWINSVGLSATYHSRYSTAQDKLEEGLELLSSAEDSDEEIQQQKAVLLENLGTVKRKQGKIRAAWDAHKDSLEISEELGDKSGIAESLNNLGSINIARGKYDAAEFPLSESVKLKRELGDDKGISTTLDNLGIVERHKNNLADSISLHQEALEIERERGMSHGVAKTLNNLGLSLTAQEKFDLAEQKHSKALDIFQEIDDTHGIAQSFGNLGLLQQKKGDEKEAIQRFKQAYEMFADLNAYGDAINTAKNIALIHDEQNNPDRVTEWCNKGERLSTQLGRSQQANMFRQIREGDFERE